MTAKEVAQNEKPFCEEHNNCELNYYCETCDQTVCMFCALTKHTSHSSGPTDQMAAKLRDEIKETNTAVEKTVKAIVERRENIDKMIKEQNHELDEIEQHYDEQIRKLMEQKEQAKAQSRNKLSLKEKAFVAQQKELDVIQEEILALRKLNEMLDKNSGKEMLSIEVKKEKRMIDDCIQEVDAKRRKIDSQLMQLDDSFTSNSTTYFAPFKQSFFDPANCELLYPESLYVGKHTVATLCTRDSQGNLCTHCSSVDVEGEVCVELESNTGMVVYATVKDNNDGSYKATFTPQHIGKAKLTASIKGQQVKGSPYDVTIYHSNMYSQPFIRDIRINDIDKNSKLPWGIAIGRYSVLAVTDYHNHCVYVLEDYMHTHTTVRERILFKRFGSHGSNNGQFHNPHGIAFDSNNNLFVVDSGNHRIQKFDVKGNFMLQFGKKGAEIGELSSPRGLVVHNGRVYIADSGNKRVSVFQTTGQFCRNICEQWLGIPCDVAVKADDELLLVAIYGQNCLNAFTLDGQSKGIFGTLHNPFHHSTSKSIQNPFQHFNSNDSSKFPCSIATDLNGFVIVSKTGGKYIEIFDKDGNHVSNSSAQGYPLGIAINSRGDIVATTHNADIHKLIQDDFPIH